MASTHTKSLQVSSTITVYKITRITVGPVCLQVPYQITLSIYFLADILTSAGTTCKGGNHQQKG